MNRRIDENTVWTTSQLDYNLPLNFLNFYAFGIPGIAVITQSTQAADNAGSDTNAAAQSNPVDVKAAIK